MLNLSLFRLLLCVGICLLGNIRISNAEPINTTNESTMLKVPIAPTSGAKNLDELDTDSPPKPVDMTLIKFRETMRTYPDEREHCHNIMVEHQRCMIKYPEKPKQGDE
jgi:hypothetical protein